MTDNNSEHRAEPIDLSKLGGERPLRAEPVNDAPRKRGFTGNKFLRYLGRSIGITFKYFGTKLLISLIIGVAAGVIFSLLKIDGEEIDGAGWYGLLAGVGNCIPIVGQWISSIAIVLFIWLFGSWKLALVAFAVLMGLQVLDEFVLTPLIVGRSLSFKPMVIMLVMIVAGMFCGPWGIIFAVPIAAVVKLGYELFYLKKDFEDIDMEG